MDRVPQKILIVQLRRIGDVIFTLPVIGALRSEFPHAQIDFLVETPSNQFVKLNPHINHVLLYDKNESLRTLFEIRERKYDWVLDFLSNGRTLLLTRFSGAPVRAGFAGPWSRKFVYTCLVPVSTDQYIVDQKMDILRALGINVKSWKWEIELPKEDKIWADLFLKDFIKGETHNKLVGIAPASRRKTRRWIPERLREVIRFFIESNHQVILFWGTGEHNFVKSLALNFGEGVIIPPPTNLLQLAALIERCSFVFGLDNGPRNIAVALGIPTLALFGPTNPVSINPHNDPKQQYLQREELSCIRCGLNECPYKHECMEEITSESVIEKIKEMIGEE